MSPSRLWIFLALLAPALVLGTAITTLGRAEAWSPSPVVQDMDSQLKRVQPQIVSVGNSKAASDISDTLLGTLGSPPLPVARLMVAGSPAPTWYAVLKYRVFEAGYRPKLVLVVGMMDPMLQTKFLGKHGGSSGEAVMTQQSPETDDIIRKKTLHQASPLWLRMNQNSIDLRDNLLGSIRDQSGALLGLSAEQTHKNLSSVFEEGNVENKAAPRLADESLSADFDPADSYIPDIVALCKSYGAQVVFVRSPLAPSFAAQDMIPTALERATIALFNQLGAGYLDMRDLKLPETDFKDGYHLTPDARDRFSTQLLQRLRQLGVLSSATLSAARIPYLPTSITRDGQPPELTLKPRPDTSDCGREFLVNDWRMIGEDEMLKLGLGPLSPLAIFRDQKALPRRNRPAELKDCAGVTAYTRGVLFYSLPSADDSSSYTAGWLPDLPLQLSGYTPLYLAYPNTTLHVNFDQGWTSDQPFKLTLQAKLLGNGTANVRIQDKTWPLRSDTPLVLNETPTGPWELQIVSPPNGPVVVVQRLAIGSAPQEDVFIGGEPAVNIRIFEVAPTDPPPPPALPEPGPIHLGKDGVPRMTVPNSAAYSANRLSGELKMRGCSPLRIYEDGTALGFPEGGLQTLKANTAGGSVHNDNDLLFRPSDHSDPLSNGRRYTIGLDPTRNCRKQWWIYPGDTLDFTIPPSQLMRMHGPIQSLAFQATTTGSPDDTTPLHIALIVEDQEVFSQDVPLNSLMNTVRGWDMSGLPTRPKTAHFRVSLPEGAPLVLMTMAAVSEDVAASMGAQ